MGDARIAALGPALGPAHELHTAETVGGGKIENLVERVPAEDGADESEIVHGVVSGQMVTQAWARLLSTILSHRTSSRSPWAKVGKAGDAGCSPFRTAA